jgi:flagellar biosynthesis/type III secretory pathway ATPase
VRGLLAAHESKRDLIALGAYKKGGDRQVDQALAALPQLEALLQQSPHQLSGFDETVAKLCDLAQRYGGA